MATIIFQPCLNLFWARSLPELYRLSLESSSTPPWRHHGAGGVNVVLETLCSSTFRLRMPHRYSIGVRTGDMLGQSINFTLSFFSKAVVVIMLEAQSTKEGDHALLSICHNTCLRSWFPQWTVAPQCQQLSCSSPQTMTLPPPCLTVGKTLLSLYSSPCCRHTRLTPSEPNKCILV